MYNSISEKIRQFVHYLLCIIHELSTDRNGRYCHGPKLECIEITMGRNVHSSSESACAIICVVIGSGQFDQISLRDIQRDKYRERWQASRQTDKGSI